MSIQKKIPLRKCVGCQQMLPKENLFRVVKSHENICMIDGKMDGRGAYICKNISCLEKATKSKGFERSFKSQVSKEIYEQIRIELNLNE